MCVREKERGELYIKESVCEIVIFGFRKKIMKPTVRSDLRIQPYMFSPSTKVDAQLLMGKSIHLVILISLYILETCYCFIGKHEFPNPVLAFSTLTCPSFFCLFFV